MPIRKKRESPHVFRFKGGVAFFRGLCKCCERPFEYQARLHPTKSFYLTRGVCDGCRRRRRKKSTQLAQANYRQRKGLKKSATEIVWNRANTEGLDAMTRRGIARQLRLKKHLVEAAERSVLLKLRNHPELKKIWGTFKEDGLPLPVDGEFLRATLAGELRKSALLDYQMRVAEFWKIYDGLTGRGCQAAALECLTEIQKFNDQIQVTMEKILNIEVPEPER